MLFRFPPDLEERACGRFQDQAKDAAHPQQPDVPAATAPPPPSTKPPPTPSRPYQREPPFSRQDVYVHHHQGSQEEGEESSDGGKYYESANGALDDDDTEVDDEDGYFVYDPEDYDNDYLIVQHKNTSRPSRTRKHEYVGSRHVSGDAVTCDSRTSSWTITVTATIVLSTYGTFGDMSL